MLLGEALHPNRTDRHPRDLPRNKLNRAIIGDPRNDENVIVSQLHSAFLRFHNRIADLKPELSFEEVQREVRWHYQWVVLHDFLRAVVELEVLSRVLPHLEAAKDESVDALSAGLMKHGPRLRDFRLQRKQDPFMPVEFSAAAYRFGHSMVRPLLPDQSEPRAAAHFRRRPASQFGRVRQAKA